jgi:hypothetical protein
MFDTISSSFAHIKAGKLRALSALDDLFRDHDLLDAFEARKVKHGVVMIRNFHWSALTSTTSGQWSTHLLALTVW